MVHSSCADSCRSISPFCLHAEWRASQGRKPSLVQSGRAETRLVARHRRTGSHGCRRRWSPAAPETNERVSTPDRRELSRRQANDPGNAASTPYSKRRKICDDIPSDEAQIGDGVKGTAIPCLGTSTSTGTWRSRLDQMAFPTGAQLERPCSDSKRCLCRHGCTKRACRPRARSRDLCQQRPGRSRTMASAPERQFASDMAMAFLEKSLT